VEDLLRHFLGGTATGVNHRVGLVVCRRTLFEQFADFSEGIAGLEQWAVRLRPHPLPNGFGRGPQTNHQRVRFQAGQIVRIRDKPAAGGNDDIAAGRECAGGILLQLPKGGFPVLGEDVGNRFAGLAFDPFIGVDEIEVQMFRGEASDRRFAGAHEPDEGKIVNDARILHRGI